MLPKLELVRPARRFTGLPSEARRRQRRELLIQAASDLLGAPTPGALTVRSVLERAQLHPRYLYENFADLDALAVAAHGRALEQLRTDVCAAVAGAGADPADHVRAVVRSTVAFVARNPSAGRLLFRPGAGSQALERRRAETTSSVVAAATRYAAVSCGGSVDPLRRAATSMLVGGLNQLLADWLAGQVPLAPEVLAEDAADLILALADRASARAAGREVEPAREPSG
jgi:AcrR family transcriptional regulator